MTDTLRRLFLPLLFSLAAYAFSQPLPLGQNWRLQKALKESALTKTQSLEVADLVHQRDPADRLERADIRLLQARIDEDMAGHQPDLTAVDTLVDQKAAMEGTLEKNRLELLTRIHKIAGDYAYFQIRPVLLD